MRFQMKKIFAAIFLILFVGLVAYAQELVTLHGRVVTEGLGVNYIVGGFGKTLLILPNGDYEMNDLPSSARSCRRS